MEVQRKDEAQQGDGMFGTPSRRATAMPPSGESASSGRVS